MTDHLHPVLDDAAIARMTSLALAHVGDAVYEILVRTHLAWLREQGLVSLTDVSGCYVAEITGRGDDVASGLATVPGVKKPRARG